MPMTAPPPSFEAMVAAHNRLMTPADAPKKGRGKKKKR